MTLNSASTSAIDGDLAKRLSGVFGISCDPKVMQFEEPKIFKSAGTIIEDHSDAVC